MDINAILMALKEERRRIDAAIAALGKVGKSSTSTLKGSRSVRRRRRMSAAARKRISEGMRRRWAARKKANAA